MKTIAILIVLAASVLAASAAPEPVDPFETTARRLETAAGAAAVEAYQFSDVATARAYFTGRAEAFLNAADMVRAAAPRKPAPASKATTIRTRR